MGWGASASLICVPLPDIADSMCGDIPCLSCEGCRWTDWEDQHC